MAWYRIKFIFMIHVQILVSKIINNLLVIINYSKLNFFFQGYFWKVLKNEKILFSYDNYNFILKVHKYNF
jgi:hypothetical protein